jgi:transcriptional regulator with XRE-family HTH domain
MNDLGDTLKVRRELLGLTQRALAAQLGIQGSHVSLLERGLRKPSMALLQRLGDALVVDGQELLALAHPALWTKADPVSPRKRLSATRQSVSDRVLMRRYHLSKDELRILETLTRAGPKISLKQYVILLTLIRSIKGSQNVTRRRSRSHRND